jgi:integrase
MTRSTGQRRHHFKNTQPTHLDIKPYNEWFPPNRNFYVSFRRWLKAGGYSEAALNVYSVAARIALGLLDKPYWAIDPLVDLETVRQHLTNREDLTSRTKSEYNKGLLKFAEFIRWHQRSPQPPRKVNWDHYTGSLPAWLAEFVRSYHAHRKCSWPADRQHRSALDLLSRLTASLRWMDAYFSLETITELTPQTWFAYVEHRLANDIKTTTINYELSCLLGFLRFLAEEGQPVCERIFRVPHLEEGWRLPKDVPISQLKLLLQAIQDEATSPHGERRRNGLRDHAWVLLMLHCGLRTCEVRRMRLEDIDWERRLVRIEQSKGLKDRHIWLTEAVFEALQAYLAVRGPVEYLPRQLFVYRHKPLSCPLLRYQAAYIRQAHRGEDHAASTQA